ncbi:MAG TPA: alpha-glucosidase [Terriglobales bacterium]|nr:alpha-glucosidase [Terriglobales bacterium]
MQKRLASMILALLLFVSLSCSSKKSEQSAENAATTSTANAGTDAEGHRWWQHAVFYEIYPRSFADSNNDGIGDLNGIDSKLDYLHWLGVDAVWLTPMYPSPQVDFGYDVSNYEDVNPQYGTLADMDRLIANGKKDDIRFILDFVMNHTSDQHPWFLESESSRNNPKRDWYIWRDGKGAGKPPNNWTSTFGGSAWTFSPKTDQWYYHYFYPQQPDLNWRNPDVKNAMFDTTRWWYKRGIAGFRLDAVDTLYEDPALTDNPVLPGKNAYGDQNQERKYNDKLPEVHTTLKELRKVADEYNAVLIGETWTDNASELKLYYGANSDELQMPMDFMFTTVNRVSAPDFRKQIAAVDGSGGWPVYVLSNHDIRRVYDRYGDGVHNDQIAKMMATLYLTLRGTPIMYYGEEIGMENNDPKRKQDVMDPIGRLGWPKEKGRDGERTPMQWTPGENAGFSTAKPWNPVDPRYKTYNVETEKADPNSILNHYQRLLALRHTDKALLDGKYSPLNENDPNVLAFLRSYQGENVLVVLNMSKTPQKVKLDLSSRGVNGTAAKTLVSSFNVPSQLNLSDVELEPFGAVVAQVQ